MRSSKFPPAVRTWAQFLMLLRHQHKLSRVSWPGYCGGDTHRHHRRFCLAVTWAFSTDRAYIEIWTVSACPNAGFLLAIVTISNMGPQPLALHLDCLHSISMESEKWQTFIHLHNHKRIMSISIFSIRYMIFIILPLQLPRCSHGSLQNKGTATRSMRLISNIYQNLTGESKA